MPNPRNANGHRRRTIRRRVLAHYTHCALCGQPVDKTLPAGHPAAPEVDEIIPISLGGSPTRWDNVQLAHRLCNQRKSNKTNLEQPATTPIEPTTSRTW